MRIGRILTVTLVLLAAGCQYASLGVDAGCLTGDTAALSSSFYGAGSSVEVDGGCTANLHLVGGGRYVQYRFDPGIALFRNLTVTDAFGFHHELGDIRVIWPGLVGIQFTCPLKNGGAVYLHFTPLGDGVIGHAGVAMVSGDLSYDNVWRLGLGYSFPSASGGDVCWTVEAKLVFWDLYNSGGGSSEYLGGYGIVVTLGPRYLSL
ncbi:MAG: hypothetical protein JW909_07550 [Planctomycetes bacterium]|nr:hypothetical protein [Planctomycetota bacterium]